jgi:two-component system, sensor histidine kinase
MTDRAQNKVLVVDDNDSARYLKSRTLEGAGFRVVEAKTGLAALELSRSERPDLVLLDIKLPDIDGFEVCRRLRADPLTESIAIVQITASYEHPDYQVRGLEGGADIFLLAPIDPNVLVANVRAMIRLRRAENALRESDRRKDEFLAVLAHELRNPLAPLRTSLSLIELANVDDPKVRASQAIMRRQLDQMVRLIDDLLDVSRINQNKLELRKTQTTIRYVLDLALETARPGIEAAGHRVQVHIPTEPVYVFGDAVRLGQVFANLLTNSVKYMDPGGSITITAEPEDDAIAVSVTDTGYGIDQKALPRMFQMFAQSHQDSDAPRGGLGIGLALVKRLVEMHGGTVAAKSAGRGKGSTFIVRLLTSREPVKLFVQGQSGDGIGLVRPRRRLLVVDDNVDAAASLSMLLDSMGHEVRTAHDGDEAFDLAADFQPEIIFMDVAMPRVSGLDAAQRIRGAPWGRNVVICALTGFGQDEDRRRSHEAGIDLHLVKPVDADELQRVLTT